MITASNTPTALDAARSVTGVGALLIAALALAATPGRAAPVAGPAPAKAPAAAAGELEKAVAACGELLDRRPSPFADRGAGLEGADAPDPLREIGALESASRACRDRVMFTYAGSPQRLAEALRAASLGPTISSDGRLWFVGADVVTGGTASVVEGRFYRVDETGRLRPAGGMLTDVDTPGYDQFLALPFAGGTQYLATSGLKTCNTCYSSSVHILAVLRDKVVDLGGFSLEYRMYEGDLEVELRDGKALRRIPGEKGSVVILRYRIVIRADDFGAYAWTGELNAPGGPGECPAAPAGKAGAKGKDATPPADPTRCELAGRVVYDGESFSILDVNGRCVDDLSPGLRRLCRSGL